MSVVSTITGPQSAVRLRRPALALAAACLVGIALRVWIGWWLGFLSDLTIYQQWAAGPGRVNLPASYKVSPNNYPPIYPSMLRLLYWVHRGLDLPGDFTAPLLYADQIPPQRPLILLLKTPTILADAASAVLIFAIGVHLGRPWLGVAVASFYLFNPAILYDGAYYGQTDTVLLTFVIAAIWAYLTRRPAWLAAMAMAAMLFKAQAFVVLLVLGAAVLGEWRTVWGRHWRRLLGGALGCIAAVVALAGVTGQLAQFYNGYFIIVGFFPIVTSHAFNLWWLLCRPWNKPPFQTDFPPDNVRLLGLVSYRTIGVVLFWAGMTVIFWRLHRARYTQLAVVLAAAAAGWAFFNLPTEIHERYAVPAVGTMCLLPLWDRRWWLPTLLASVTLTFNITDLAPFHFPPWPGLAYYVNTFIWAQRDTERTLFAVVHVLMLPLCLERLWRMGGRQPKPATLPEALS